MYVVTVIFVLLRLYIRTSAIVLWSTIVARATSEKSQDYALTALTPATV